MGTELRRYQDALMENVFQHKNKHTFLHQEKLDTEVTTFDGQLIGFISWDDLKKIVGQFSVLGPIAGLYGRNIEQELMHLQRGYYISERKFAHSVESARYALKKEMIHQHPDKAKTDRSDQSDDDHSENHNVRKMKEILQRQRMNK